MQSVAELKSWISAQFWKSEQVSGWVNNNFFRKASHQRASNGATSANLPIALDSNGLIDPSFIAEDSITNAKLANMAQGTVKGRTTVGTGDPEDLTMAQLVALIEAQALYALLAGRSGGQRITGIASTGIALEIYRNLTATSTNSPVFQAYQDHASDDQPVAVFRQDGSGNIVEYYNKAGQKVGYATQDSNYYVQRSDSSGLGTGGFVSYDLLNDASARIQFIIFNSAIGGNQFGISRNGAAEFLAINTKLFIGTFGSQPVYFGTNDTLAGMIDTSQRWFLGGLTSGNANVLGVKAGTSSNDAAVGGVISVSSTATGNVGAGEDDLLAYNVPINTLSANNMSIKFEATGTIANTANAKTVSVRFGGTLIGAVGLPTSTDGDWTIYGRGIRTGASAMKWSFTLAITLPVAASSAIAVRRATTAVALSSAQILKITGTGTANNDVVCESLIVDYDDANT